MQSEQLVHHIAQLIDDKKGVEISIIDLRQESSYTDFLLLASGTSDRHVSAMGTHVTRTLKDANNAPLGTEGLRQGQWVLVDCGDVVVHLFHQFTRTVYDLDGLWQHAPRLPLALDTPTEEALINTSDATPLETPTAAS